MHPKPSAPRAFWNQALCISCRALLGGPLAALAAGLFCAACGGVLCWAHGMPLTFAGLCGLRGAFAGLVAGTIMGAMSGIYHVEEPRPAGAKVETCKGELANCNPAPERPFTPPARNGKAHSRLG